MDNQTEHNVTHNMKDIFSENFTFTKRQVGIALLTIGTLAFVGIFALDFIGGGREGGIGPAQLSALVLMGFIALIGLSLIPLGDDPA
ncbi:MAG: hypothetical protein Phog2KO_04350 [Phototrophicaceae bacterium]